MLHSSRDGSSARSVSGYRLTLPSRSRTWSSAGPHRRTRAQRCLYVGHRNISDTLATSQEHTRVEMVEMHRNSSAIEEIGCLPVSLPCRI